MKTSYKALSVVLGATALLSSFTTPLFVVVTSPISGSTATVKFNLKQIIDMLSINGTDRFINNLFYNSAYANFCPKFLTAFIFFWSAVICSLLIIIFSIVKNKYIYNIVCSAYGLISLLISAIAISSISSQAVAGNSEIGKNLLDIFDQFLNIQSINCGTAFFFMGLCFIVVFTISGSLAIVNKPQNNNK